jgi:hypothetical protein
MKDLNKVIKLVGAILVLNSCSTESQSYATFGESFNQQSKSITSKELNSQFDDLEIGDTANVVFTTKIDAVCQKKGCWMDVDLANDEVARVTFLDYGFFVPLNSSGSEAIIKGKAFWKSETAAEKRHFAEDAGENIDSIQHSEEEYTPHILATGVLIKK